MGTKSMKLNQWKKHPITENRFSQMRAGTMVLILRNLGLPATTKNAIKLVNKTLNQVEKLLVWN